MEISSKAFICFDLSNCSMATAKETVRTASMPTRTMALLTSAIAPRGVEGHRIGHADDLGAHQGSAPPALANCSIDRLGFWGGPDLEGDVQEGGEGCNLAAGQVPAMSSRILKVMGLDMDSLLEWHAKRFPPSGFLLLGFYHKGPIPGVPAEADGRPSDY